MPRFELERLPCIDLSGRAERAGDGGRDEGTGQNGDNL
jgi:hypothetical protein